VFNQWVAEHRPAKGERRSPVRVFNQWAAERRSALRAHRVVLQIILEDVEQVVGKAVGAVAFAVFLHFGDHAAQGLGIDAFFAGALKPTSQGRSSSR